MSCLNSERSLNRPTIYESGEVEEPAEKKNTNNSSTTAERPNLAVILQSGACACLASKSILLGNGSCNSFCAAKPSSPQEILYIKTQLSDSIILNDELKNLENWCKKEISDGRTNPSCSVNLLDDNDGVTKINIDKFNADNSFEANITALNYGQTYRLFVMENTSEAKSTTIQIRKEKETTVYYPDGPLMINPVSQYTCLSRTIIEDTGSNANYFMNYYRMHFYFIEKYRPDALALNIGTLLCHDFQRYGNTDSHLYARFEETPNVFSLWGRDDTRFYSLDGSGKLGINKLIEQYVNDLGQTLNSTPDLFFEFKWPGQPTLSAEAGASNDQILGYFMTPWIDPTTNRAYCPNMTHFYSNNLIFRAMRDYVGETEGLFIAKRQKGSYLDDENEVQSIPEDYILLPENIIKKIWFYLNSSMVPVQPTDSNINSKKIIFYYPYDLSSPFIQKSHQSVYVVQSASDLGSLNVGSASSTGVRTSLPIHDRRIGCIPKLDLNSN